MRNGSEHMLLSTATNRNTKHYKTSQNQHTLKQRIGKTGKALNIFNIFKNYDNTAIDYSVLRLFTGFAIAARIAW